MTVSNGRDFLAIPGPTNIPDAVLSAMHRPSIDIYDGELVGVTETCLDAMRRVFATRGRTYVYAANGHGAWEAALVNVLSRGDRVLVLESGRFAHNWGVMGATMGIDVETLEGSWRRAVDPAAVEERLRADPRRDIKAVLIVQVDTASGVVNDVPAIRRALDAADHPALLMVDTIASLATMPFEMDAWGVDVAVAASQKGLMMSPGLGFVAAGDRAVAAHAGAGLRTRYWDWTAREGPLHYEKYCGTPPVHLMFGLAKALEMLLAEGVEAAARRHALLAEATRRAVSVWADAGELEFNVLDAAQRSNSVTTVLTNGVSADAVRAYCAGRCGVTIGGGIGDLKGRALRVAHMGYVNAPMVIGTLGAIEMALAALGAPHGRGGVQAAVDYLAGEVGA